MRHVAAPLDARLIDSCVGGCASSHQRLLEVVDALDDAAFDEPSALPGWTRAHVIGHLTMNALSHVRLLQSAAGGETGEQYEGGAAGREAGITESAAWAPEKLKRELRRAVYTLEGAWAGASSVAWQGTGLSASGALLQIADLPFLRWREVVIHLTDLNVGFECAEWPALYVRLELDRQKMAWAASRPMGLTLLPARAQALPDHERVAWLVGRLAVDGLPQGPGL